MSYRTALATASIVMAISITGCSAAKSGDASITTPAFGATTDASSVTGGVSSIAGACPSTTFIVERKNIRTDASTTFGDGGCAAVKNGVRVEVTGTTQSDGSVKASRVSVVSTTTTTPTPTTTTYSSIVGNVTALAGSCPQLTITVGEKKATTNASTVFDVRACIDYKIGAYTEIVGAAVATTAVLQASTVTGRK